MIQMHTTVHTRLHFGTIIIMAHIEEIGLDYTGAM